MDREPWRLHTVDEAPQQSRDAWIGSGYRPSLDYRGCLWSSLRIHNETVNIWTHLLGFLFFHLIFLQELTAQQPREWRYWSSSLLQLLSYQLALLNSSLVHNFLCHQPSTRHLWFKLDQAGILLSLFATYVRVLVTIFHCSSYLLSTHLLVVCFLFISLLVTKRRSKSDSVAVGPLLVIAVYGVAPILQWGAGSGGAAPGLPWLLLPYIQGGLGVGLYLTHLPERLLPPGLADIWGSSHQCTMD